MASSGLEGGLPLALARGCAIAALLSAFGSLTFQAVVWPKVMARVPEAVGSMGSVNTFARASLIAAIPLLLVWCLLQSADLASTSLNMRRTLEAVPAVLQFTRFGHLLLGQLAATAVALAVMPRWHRAALMLSASALLLQAGHGHAWSMADPPELLVAASPVHLLAAGAWLGGLVPLLLIIRDTPPQVGALAARWFSPLGKACVAAMVASSAVQSWFLIGGLAGLFGTPYGWIASIKLGLLGILFAFAVANRYQLAPALLQAMPETARRRLVRAIALQTGFGLATVLAASVLSNLPPAVHEQPAWPAFSGT